MKTIFTAIYGIFRHELIYEFKTGLFIGGVILPIIVTLIFGVAIGYQGVPPRNLPVGTYQQADIFPDGQLMINSTEAIKITRYNSIPELVDAIDTGRIVAGLIIEKPNTSLVFKIIQDDTKSVIVRAAVSAINKELLKLAPSQTNDTQTILIIESRYGFDLNAENYLLQILSPGFLVMASIYIVIIVSGFVLAQERENNTIYELALAPVPQWSIISGKLFAGILLLALETSLVYLLVSTFIIPAKGNVLEIILVAILCGTGLTGILYIVTSYVKSFQQVRLLLGIPVFIPLIFLSGIFYPLESFPDWLQAVAEYIPTAWANEIIKNIFFKGKSLLDYPVELAKLVIWAVGTPIIGSTILRRILTQN